VRNNENEQEEEGDNHPGGEINGNGVYFLPGLFRGRVGIADTGAGNQEGCKGEPESTVRSECCSKRWIRKTQARRRNWHAGSAKGVASGKLPHSSKELSKTTAEKCHTNNNVGDVNATGVNIVEGQNQCRGGEGEETTVEIGREKNKLVLEDTLERGK
jgi:hypothetical protein